jgi:hypothetical protein
MRKWWLFVAIALVLLAALWGLLITNKPEFKNQNNSTPDKGDAAVVQSRQDEARANPIFQNLPYSGSEFKLTFGYSGVTGNKYSLIAYVTVAPGENADAKIKQEQPKVIKYLQSIGQPDGTYTIEYETQSK